MWLGGLAFAALGADMAYDAEDFVNELRSMRVTPHVAQNTTNRRSAIDRRTTRHGGYPVSQRIRKRIEEAFGWIKTVAGQQKTSSVASIASAGPLASPPPTISCDYLGCSRGFSDDDADSREGNHRTTMSSTSSRRCNTIQHLAANTTDFFNSLLVLLSQKVAADTRSDSDNRRDSGISRWRLIWISEQLATVNRGFRLMSRGL